MTVVDVEIPISPLDPINRSILEVSEDQIHGFVREPVEEIASRSGVPFAIVVERLRAMLGAGMLRRIRQTLAPNNLAHGALIAWEIPRPLIEHAFDYLAQYDPFSGHVVIRSADGGNASFGLWTTLKVPTGFSIEKHCRFLCYRLGAIRYHVMPPIRVFALGVGHVRRRGIKVGEMAPRRAEAKQPSIVVLTDDEWLVLTELKRDLDAGEIGAGIWRRRAERAGIDPDTFVTVAERLDRKGLIGRFSTFLEHSKEIKGQPRLTEFNALFHWAVPPGREIEAGEEIGRFAILTHCYWREGGPALNNVNIMAVAHGQSKQQVLAHKKAIDDHLDDLGIGFTFTTTYWGGRAEIKPSELSPATYERWCREMGIDPAAMRG